MINEEVYAKNLNINGCMEMFGKCVHLAINDYQMIHKYYEKLEEMRKKLSQKKRISSRSQTKLARLIMLLSNYDSAQKFLFSEDGLEYFIEKGGMPLNIQYIRRIASGESLSRSMLNNQKQEG